MSWIPQKIAEIKSRFALLLICMLIVPPLFAQQQPPIRVGFLCAAPLDNPFWSQVIDVMQASADDLNMELIVKCDPTRSTYATKRLGSKLLSLEPKIDYFLTKYWPSVTEAHLQQAQERGIKVFIFNSDINAEDSSVIGVPRERFKNWIGHMVPDDKKASAELTKHLITYAETRPENSKGRIHVLGLSAPADTAVGHNRREGLQAQVTATPSAILQDIVVVNWTADSAREAVAELLAKYPLTDVIWAANEAIAWGAVQAVEHLNKKPGKDIVVGGFDWNPESLPALADGRMTASMFGHFMEGAWSMVLVHDYHHGFDFVGDTGARLASPLGLINATNYNLYKSVLNEQHWQDVDFRRFSKKYNSDIEAYNFNINQFLK